MSKGQQITEAKTLEVLLSLAGTIQNDRCRKENEVLLAVRAAKLAESIEQFDLFRKYLRLPGSWNHALKMLVSNKVNIENLEDFYDVLTRIVQGEGAEEVRTALKEAIHKTLPWRRCVTRGSLRVRVQIKGVRGEQKLVELLEAAVVQAAAKKMHSIKDAIQLADHFGTISGRQRTIEHTCPTMAAHHWRRERIARHDSLRCSLRRRGGYHDSACLARLHGVERRDDHARTGEKGGGWHRSALPRMTRTKPRSRRWHDPSSWRS